jgi:hypothetical protein
MDQVYQAVTANRLTDGVPVYFTRTGGWSAQVADAAHASDGAALLADSGAATPAAVSPYIIDVEIVDGAVRPVGLREQIRAYGPTV